ncbi:MAG: Uncharacterised protein [Rhodospirillaceae bacterium]|nr:MAG: Uncharacterised protein [Rhodospirillaceae bacterium]
MKRSIVVTRSAPMVDSQTPNTPPIKFFIAPPALILASIDRPKIVSAKYSGGRNSYATLANRGAAKHNTITDTTPPKVEDTTATPRARPASPRWASGKPSKVVAAAAEVPGVLIRIAVIDPAKVAAT